MSGLHLIGWIATAAGAAGALFGMDRLFLWMERRGWIYWRRKRGSGGCARVLTGVQEFVEPQVQHVIQDQEERHCTIDERADSTK
jgi:hypothetical protein